MKRIHIILEIIIILSMFSVNVFADDTQVLTYKAHVENNQITVTEDELISDVDNSDLNVRVVKRSGETETLMYTGPLGGYENGVYSFCDFSDIQFLVIFDWDTMENEAIYIIPIDDNNRNSIDNNVSQKLETGKSLIRQSNLITTAIDDAEINISLLYNNSYSECVLLPGEELTAEINVKNNDAINDIPLSTIIALYDNNGKLLSINTESVTVNADGNDTLINNIVVPVDDTVSTAKIMIWESVNSLKPYAEPVILTLNGNDFFGDDYTMSQPLIKRNSANGIINALDDIDVFEFTPLSSGLYYFETFSDIDTYASLYADTDLNHAIASNDNDGVDGNFKLSATLEEGTTYYLYVNSREIGNYLLNAGYAVGNIYGTVAPTRLIENNTEYNELIDTTITLTTYDTNEYVASMNMRNCGDSINEFSSFSITGIHSNDYMVRIKKPGYLALYKKIQLSDNAVDIGSKILIAGDINDDNIVNQDDLALISNLFNLKLGDDHYLAAADLNGDMIIDQYDYQMANANIGLNSNCYNENVNVLTANVTQNDNLLSVNGYGALESQVSCIIFKNNINVYEEINEVNSNGYFEFETELNKAGTYKIIVRDEYTGFTVEKTVEY